MKIIHHRDAEFTEFGVFLDQQLFTPCPQRPSTSSGQALRGESAESFVAFVSFVVRISFVACCIDDA
jgi:hypothetical protein